jgi:predicted transcriptional regulator
MDAREAVLDAMRQAGKPVSAGEVEKISGLDKKEVDKVFKVLKKDNIIISPVRCKWEIASR